MKKSHLIVFAVVVALGGYLAYDMQSETKETTRKEQEAKLFPFPSDQVNEMSLSKKGGASLKVSRSEDGWKVVEPFQDQADDFFTDDFVKRLSDEKIVGVAKEGADIDWAVYGLDQPAGQFSLKLQNGEQKTLLISEKKNFEQNSFGRLEGDNRALIVSPAWVSHLEREALDFRDKRILRAKIGDVRTLVVKTPREGFFLERKDNTWGVHAQPHWELDQNRVREILSMINETRADAFPVTGVPTEAQRRTYGLSRPVVTIDSQLGDDRSWKIELGRNAQAQEFAVISNPAFVVGLEAGTIAKFEKMNLEGLRDKKKAFEVSLDGAQKISWETPVKKTSFVKKDGTWVADGKGDQNPDSTKVQAFLSSIQDSRVLRYASGTESSSFRPTNHLRVYGSDDKVLFEISWMGQTISQGKDRSRLAKTNLIKDIFHLSEDNLSKWSPSDLMPSKEAPQENP